MFPIVISLSAWADQLANKCTTFHAENQTLSEVINKKSTENKELFVLLRALVLFCLKHSYTFKAKHLPGVLNTKADAFSQLQGDNFKSLAKDMASKLTAVPHYLLPENWPL